tara:strand:- start:32 stop:286 length:255 start_codon:yes stop_codon:yes gene_type:complete
MRTYQGTPFIYFKNIEEAKDYEGNEFCISEMPDNSWFSYKNKNYKINLFNSENQMMICQDENGIKCQIDSTDNAIYLGSFPSKL